MRRALPLILGLSAAVLLTAAPAFGSSPSLERHLAAGKDRVELRQGRGTAIFRTRGAIFGFFARGSLRVTDLPRGMKTKISVTGAENVKRINKRTKVYSGRNVNFYIQNGWWRAVIQGRGIGAGAAVQGTLVLVGESGTYRLRDGEAQSWPAERRVFQLG